MLARFCPTAICVEAEWDLASVMASSLRQRRVRAHLGVYRRALALVLQLELSQHFPIRVGTVVKACSMLPCLALPNMLLIKLRLG